MSPAEPVTYAAHLDEAWHGVCVDADRALLMQAIGRARVLDAVNGIDVTVVTTQPLPFGEVIDLPTAEAAEVLWLMRLRGSPMPRDEIAGLLGITDVAARKRLEKLRESGQANTHHGLWSRGEFPNPADLVLRRHRVGTVEEVAASAGLSVQRFRRTCTGVIERGVAYDHRPERGCRTATTSQSEEQCA